MNKTRFAAWPLIVAATCVCGSATADEKYDYPLAPMSFEQVTLQDSFWLPRLRRQAETTVPHALTQTEPAVENLRRCGNFCTAEAANCRFPIASSARTCTR